MASSVAAVAIISATNKPLYIKTNPAAIAAKAGSTSAGAGFAPSSRAVNPLTDTLTGFPSPGDTAENQLRIKLLYLLHASLDVVEEKIGVNHALPGGGPAGGGPPGTTAGPPPNRDTYLAILNQCENYKIYGFVSATKVKVLLMISASHVLR